MEASIDELRRKIRQAFIMFDVKPRNPYEIYVTEAVGCLRRAFFNIKFNANPVLESADVIMGKLVHLALPKVLKDIVNAEFEVPLGYNISGPWVLSGRADAMDADMVYEFKFSSPYSDAKPIYFMQANAYAVMAERPMFALVIIDKKTFDVDIMVSEADVKGFNAVVERAKTIISCVERNEVPPGPDYDWQCKNCPYALICVEGKKWIGQKPLKP
ncbi:hypothetical protein DRO69_06230 [Candidatus Bathyarchaeota archaeon]|nr:MAG: hypothetical protein DRO69_06230 [Candidatus Bathyarchaeota archaeon]